MYNHTNSLIMTCKELSNLIIQNRDSMAFLVGNGIHNYETHNLGIQGKVNWDELIDNVRKQLAPHNTHGFINEGNKLPKKFDAIVQENLLSKPAPAISDIGKNLSMQINDIENKQTLRISNLDAYILQKPRIDSLNIASLSHLINDESLKQAEKTVNHQIEIILKSVGIQGSPMSFDMLELANHLALGGKLIDFAAKQIIKSQFENYTLQKWIVPFLRVAEGFRIPILTTNYDISLSQLACLSPRITVGANVNVQKGFPFETYFAPSPINYPWDSFAIWHIHGIYNYVNSIRIGQVDYENLQREIQARLTKTTNPFTDNNWDGNNSWLSIVFHKNLFIIGLGLEADEEVLWWLLKERAKYGLKGWYVYIETENVVGTKAKKLRDVGFEIIKVNNIDLYENTWKDILNKLDCDETGGCLYK